VLLGFFLAYGFTLLLALLLDGVRILVGTRWADVYRQWLLAPPYRGYGRPRALAADGEPCRKLEGPSRADRLTRQRGQPSIGV